MGRYSSFCKTENLSIRIDGEKEFPRAYVVYNNLAFWLPVCQECRKYPLLHTSYLSRKICRQLGYENIRRDLEKAGVDCEHWDGLMCLSCSGEKTKE